MAATTSCTILGPYPPKDFIEGASSVTTIAAAVVTAAGNATIVSADPHTILGNVWIFVTTTYGTGSA
jgi:hypothetical protein